MVLSEAEKKQRKSESNKRYKNKKKKKVIYNANRREKRRRIRQIELQLQAAAMSNPTTPSKNPTPLSESERPFSPRQLALLAEAKNINDRSDRKKSAILHQMGKTTEVLDKQTDLLVDMLKQEAKEKKEDFKRAAQILESEELIVKDMGDDDETKIVPYASRKRPEVGRGLAPPVAGQDANTLP